MNQLNSIILEGNLCKDAVIEEPSVGFKVSRFTIGVNRWYMNSKNEGVSEASYFDIEAYGKMAEYSIIKGKKGRGIRVVGRLKQNTWTDDEGKYHSKVFVVAEHLEYKPFTQDVAEESSSAQNPKVEEPVLSPQKEEAVAF